METTLGEVNIENTRLKTYCSERENNLDKQCAAQQTDIQGKQDLINLLNLQLTEGQEARKTIESNLAAALRTRESPSHVQFENPGTTIPTIPLESDLVTENQDEAQKVIIFHDSLCKNINETLMGREDVTVSKVWAPTLMDTQTKVDEVDNVETIVIQALTRDIGKMTAEELPTLTYETVEKCLLKSNKVIVSLVVNREDDESIQAKLGIVNANIKYNYLKNSRVLVCHHNNLIDRRYRSRDKLHLTEGGTSRLANNLKHKIAESLGIIVYNRRRDGQRYDEKYDASKNRFDNRRYQGNRHTGSHQYNGYDGFNDYKAYNGYSKDSWTR